MRYKLSCDLPYDVKGPTTFIFNFEVAKPHRHHDPVQTLTVTPDLPRRTYVVPDSCNRYVSVSADEGPLNVRYEAEVTLDVAIKGGEPRDFDAEVHIDRRLRQWRVARQCLPLAVLTRRSKHGRRHDDIRIRRLVLVIDADAQSTLGSINQS